MDKIERLFQVASGEVRGARWFHRPGMPTRLDIHNKTPEDCKSIARWIESGDGVNPPPGYSLPEHLELAKRFDYLTDLLACAWRAAAEFQKDAARACRLARGAGRAAMDALESGCLQDAVAAAGVAVELEREATGSALYWGPFAAAVAERAGQIKGAKGASACVGQSGE
jgi:hypothetical protein